MFANNDSLLKPTFAKEDRKYDGAVEESS